MTYQESTMTMQQLATTTASSLVERLSRMPGHVQRILRFHAGVVAVAFLVAGLHASQAAEDPVALKDAKPTMPHARLAAILSANPLINASGNRVPLDRVLSKKYIFVYFSGHYCKPCRLVTPRLIAFYKERFRGGDFEFLFSDDFDIRKEAMTEYMAEANMPWPCIRYDDPSVAGVRTLVGRKGGVPDLYLLDQNDEVIAKPTSEGTDHQSWYPVNKWLSLHHLPPNHWNFWEKYHAEYPDDKH